MSCPRCAELQAEVSRLQSLLRGPDVRANDHGTSVGAAKAVRPKIQDMHQEIMRTIEAWKIPVSARELEQLPKFLSYSPSTVRKRVSELVHLGYLEPVGAEMRSGKRPCATYEPTGAWVG